MTLKRRIDRLERDKPRFYADVSEIPTPVLDAMLRRAWQDGNLSPEESELFRQLKEAGFEFTDSPTRI
jgi:hypothetical protein